MSSQYGTLPSRPRAWVSAETIQLLGMESQRGGFWPRLFLLECNIDWEIVPFISSFLSPTITDLDLTLPRENNRLLQPTLSLLTHTCRQLQSLKVDVDTSDPPSGAEMGRLISVSRHTLHRINIRPSTPPEIFPVIFDLPLLRSLTLQEPRLPNQFPPGILPPLETIYLNGSHGPNLTQFLRRLSVQRLVAVSVYCGEIIQLSMFLDSLCGATQTANYLYLSPVSAFDRFSITLLRTFTNLTYLTIRCVCECREMSWPCSFQLTDEDLLDLGGALPYIRTLGLGPGCHRPCHATFKSLTCLSRMCGNLENLLIRVDFASIVDSSDQPNHSNTSLRVDDARPQRERSRLSMLMIGNSPLPDTPRCEWLVALALATIFPSIKLLISSCPGGMGKRWSRVRGDIRICRKIFHITQGEGKRLTCVR